jgi:hypothetical protein
VAWFPHYVALIGDQMVELAGYSAEAGS